MKIETVTIRPSKKNNSLIKELKKLAKADNRTLNNFVEGLLINYINQIKTPTL